MPDSRTRRNVLVLALSQAVATSTIVTHFAFGGLVGHLLAADPRLSTLPVTAVVGGTALATVPAAMTLRRLGRRNGFIIGALCGLAGSLVSSVGIATGSFWLFTLGALIFGAFSAFAHFYRFAAADAAAADWKSRAISLVLAGGVVAGFAGPEIAKHTKDLFPSTVFLGTFLAAAALCLSVVGVLAFLDLLREAVTTRHDSGRPLSAIARQPVFVVAVASAMVGYAAMSLMMTATPLAMKLHHHPFDAAATVIQWHVIAMYVPSFFTGVLIARFGVFNVILAGAALELLCIGLGLAGVEMLHFWGAMTLLGLGWNFMFVGATTLLTEAYAPAEQAKAQAVNDFMVFGLVAVASLSAGTLLHGIGWTAVLLAATPFVLGTAGMVLWLAAVRRRLEPA